MWVPSAEQDDPDYEQWRWQVLTESGILQDSDYCARQGIYRFQPGVPRPPGLPAGAAQPVLRTRLCKRVGLLEGGVCQLPLCAPISADPARGYLEVKINRGPCEPHAKTGATVLCVKQPSEASAKGWAGLTVGSVFGVVHATTNAGEHAFCRSTLGVVPGVGDGLAHTAWRDAGATLAHASTHPQRLGRPRTGGCA